MQENLKITVGISPEPEVLNPQCSCTECESISCFVKRRTLEPCTCNVCRNSKSCLFYKENINHIDNKSCSVNYKDIERELKGENNNTTEVIKKEIIYEFDKNNQMKSISKKQSRLFYKTVDPIQKVEDRNDGPSTRDHSAANTNSHKAVTPSTAELSAQIMDVPYKEFQKSICKPKYPSNLSNISPFDILNRIKEAYKACSCKVCECIIGKSLQNDLCKCKPCECNECANFTRQVKSFRDEGEVPKDDEGCPCIRCDRGSCKGIGKGKRTQECDCVGVLQCNYHKSNGYTRDCNCEPCQCIECESRSIHRHRALIVAPVEEDYSRRNACRCSPCDCFECAHGFRLSSNLHNEMSTSMNRHPHCHCDMCVNEACLPDGNQSCKCERQGKVMSKPFQQDSHDYDIRRTNVTYNDAHKRREINNCDTIAMYAAITNSYSKHEKIKECDCDQCECILCKYKNNNMENPCSSKVFKPIQNYQLRNQENDCKFSACECQFCAKHDAESRNINNCNVCKCEMYEYMICDGLARSNKSDTHGTKKPTDTYSAKGDCRCDPCECAECEKLRCSNENCVKETYSDEVIYPVKRGERLTPSLFKSKIKDAFIESCISTLEANEDLLQQREAFKSSLKKPSAFGSFQTIKTRDGCNIDANQNCYRESYSNHQITPHNFITRNETVKHALISKCANCIHLHGKNIAAALESNLSAYSSMSFLKDTESITPSRCKLKSWESSCNSSGHDYPSYLIHFPKTTVESCLNDVMQLDAVNNNDIRLTPIALSSKNNFRKQNNRDLNENVLKLPEIGVPMKIIYSQDNPADAMNNQSQTREDSYFKYSTQNFENCPYIPQNFESTHININKKDNIRNSLIIDSTPITYKVHSSPRNKSNTNSFVLDEDYERVQNTLKEARAFSLHLVRLLEKYEKANKEFKSVTEKIKKSNVSLPNKTNIQNHPNIEENLICTLDTDQVPTKEQQKNSSGSSTEELVAIYKNANKTDKVLLIQNNDHIFYEDKVDDNSENISMNETNEGRNESGDDINKTNEVLNTITEEIEPNDVSHKQDKKKRVVTKLHRRFNKMYKRSMICSKKIKSSTNSSSVEVDATVVKINNTPILDTNRPIEMRQNIIIPIKINNTDKEPKEDFIDLKSPKLTEHEKMLQHAKKSTTELRVSVTEKYANDHHFFQKDVFMIKQPMFEESHTQVRLSSRFHNKN